MFTVVERLEFDRWNIAAVLVESSVVEPVHPFNVAISTCSTVRHGLRGLINSVL